jgi:uncharacterized OsmC-like protein
MILEKSHKHANGCGVERKRERVDKDPKGFTVHGEKPKPAVVERTIEISSEKYLSASKMFETTVNSDYK